jgi:hypothetical protein
LKRLEAVSDVVGFPAESARRNLSLECWKAAKIHKVGLLNRALELGAALQEAGSLS